MKIKRKLSDAEYNALDDNKKALYVQQGSEWVLDMEDTAFEEMKREKVELKAKLEQFEAEKKAAEDKAAEEKAKREKDKMDKHKKEGEWEAYVGSLEKKIETLENTLKETQEGYRNRISNEMLTREVDRIANEVSTAPSLLKPFIRDRLTVEFVGEEPRIFVKDDKGHKSATSIKEFEKSIIDNSEFSAIIKQTAGGAGTQNQDGFSGTKTINNNQAPQGGSVNILDMTLEQQAAFAKQLEATM